MSHKKRVLFSRDAMDWYMKQNILLMPSFVDHSFLQNSLMPGYSVMPFHLLTPPHINCQAKGDMTAILSLIEHWNALVGK